MELMDAFESVADSGREQETVLGHYSEADTVLHLGVWRTELGWAVLQEGRGRQQLLGSGLQAELGTGVGLGAGAELKAVRAEQSEAGLLQDSRSTAELETGSWLAAPVSGAIIYSVFVHLYL